MQLIAFHPSNEMNLLGYFLRALIERNLQTKRGQILFSKIRGIYLVGASDMQVTLDFQGDRLEITVGKTKPPDCWVWGRLDALLAVGLRKGFLLNFCLRRLKAGGKIWRLLKLIGLLRIQEQS